MNITLWIFQVLLAVHTVTGAVWKFSHSEQSVPSLKALPHGVWMALSVMELLCSVGLLLPVFGKRLTRLASMAAVCIAAEMLLFSAVHLQSGASEHGPMVYWLVVTAPCAFVAYGRFPRRAEPTTT